MDLVPLILLSPVLAAVAYFDLRYMHIPNLVVFAALGLFLLTMPFMGWSEVALRLLAASLVFAIGLAVFGGGPLGGGDVRMMSALLLFVPTDTYSLLALGFSVSMLAGMTLVILARMVPELAASSWVSLKGRGTFPTGLAIAMTGLAHPFVVLTVG